MNKYLLFDYTLMGNDRRISDHDYVDTMDSAYCPSLKKEVSANKVFLGIVPRNYQFYCPKCKEAVIFRDWSNANPYFAHRKYNRACPLSIEGDGDLFRKNRYIDEPCNRTLDYYLLSENQKKI